MSDDENEGRSNRKALVIVGLLLFIAYLLKAIALGGSALEIVIAVSVVTLIYGTLIGLDFFQNR